MKEQKMTMQLLRERQSWTLEQKIDHALGTIESFVNRMGGVDKVYVSFSGGKDSTVLFPPCAAALSRNSRCVLQYWQRIPRYYPICQTDPSRGCKHSDYSPETDTEGGVGEIWISVGRERDFPICPRC